MKLKKFATNLYSNFKLAKEYNIAVICRVVNNTGWASDGC